VSDFWIGVVTALLISLFRRVVIKIFNPIFMNVMKAKYIGQDREERAFKSSSNLFKLIYYSLTVGIGYYIIKDLDCFPPMMGGNGSLEKVFSDWPNWKKPNYFDIFYIACSGYHLETMVWHVLGERLSDYVEMLLHHVVTLNLIFFSYMSGFTKIGVLILWLHNWSDIFASGARATAYLWEVFPATFYLCLLTSWYYFRIFCFSFIIYEVYVTNMKIEGMNE